MLQLPPTRASRVVIARRAVWCLCASLVVGGVMAEPAQSQEPGLEVTIVYIAGTDLYLDVGTTRGIAAGDTLQVFQGPGEAYLGTVVVRSATADRSVVVFEGDPFPVTRGKPLYVTFGHTAEVEVRNDAAAVVVAPRQVGRQTHGPRTSGRLSIDVPLLRSTTRWVSDEPVRVERRFVSPSLGLRATVTDLPGGLRVELNSRATYRYSSPLVVQPAQSFRLYQATVGKRFTGAPLLFQAGRFYNVFDHYGGYFDGVLARVGGSGVGVGVAVGFEPIRSNEGLSTAVPKYSAFGSMRAGSGRLRYSSEVSFNEIRPKNGLVRRTFAGWSQRLAWNRLVLSQDLQVDRTEPNGEFAITRLRLRGTVPIGRPFLLSIRYGADRAFDPLFGDTLPHPRREQVGVGLHYWGRGAALALDVTQNRAVGWEPSYTYSTSLSLTRTPFAGIGVSAAAAYFALSESQALQWSVGLSRAVGSVNARASYSEYHTALSSRTFGSRAADLAVLAPLWRGVHLSTVLRTQWGENLLMQSVSFGIWTSF